MNNNSKTLNIPTKKAWIIGTVLSLVASIFPTWFVAEISLKWLAYMEAYKGNTLEINLFDLHKFFFPLFFIIFFLFFSIFILICKWQNKKR